jgi:hypothetical protein
MNCCQASCVVEAKMNEADYEELSQHLSEVRPIFDDFCARHQFAYVTQTSIGRYPRIRVVRSGEVSLYFDLWMQLDKNERHFEKFRRDLPYDLYAGATADVDDGSPKGTRFHKGIACFLGIPFDQVGAILDAEMEKTLRIIQAWDLQHLLATGDKHRLGGQ